MHRSHVEVPPCHCLCNFYMAVFRERCEAYIGNMFKCLFFISYVSCICTFLHNEPFWQVCQCDFKFVIVLSQVQVKPNETRVKFLHDTTLLCCTMWIIIKSLLKKNTVLVVNVRTLKSGPIAVLEIYLI